MSYKIFTKNNYFYIIDTETDKEYEALSKDVLIRRDLSNSTKFYFTGVNSFSTGNAVAFANILDADGNAYADLETWITWYTTNTGNFNTPQEGGKYPVILTLNQSGTDAPNDGVGDILWTYIENGIYTGVQNGYFTNKKAVIFTNSISVAICNILDNNTIEIRTYNPQTTVEQDNYLINSLLFLY